MQGNEVTASGDGIVLGARAIETGKIEQNRLSGNQRGLVWNATLGSPPPATFGARVRWNDVVGSVVRAVEAVGEVAGELSVDGQGNHWGRPCADDDGFREAGDPGADSSTAGLVDSHPYGEPVALTTEDALPPSCL